MMLPLDARATASLVQRLISDDPAILDGFSPSRKKWPAILQLRTPCVSRDHAQEKLQEPPRFLQRILSKTHHDTDAMIPDVVAYLALVDRILEDRVIDADEERSASSELMRLLTKSPSEPHQLKK